MEAAYGGLSPPSLATQESHSPSRMSFPGRPYNERTVIKLAYSHEQGTLHRRPPESTPPLQRDQPSDVLSEILDPPVNRKVDFRSVDSLIHPF
jgi:hypothetical protein